MRMHLLSIMKIVALGFKELKGDKLDDNGYYRWWQLQKSDSELAITYEFNSEDKVTHHYVEFNGEQLKGKTITLADIETLIKLM
ncbi:hypothetical protein [Flavobacterium sp.]|uniref:hypothetical protein n=1 Tax=Flavobacterium sp. TaxID=239 RepID=UPI004047BEB3